MKSTKKQLFKRQVTLQEVGEEGQQKLQNAKVLVVGCGGLGSPIAVYLASSGVGKIHLVDFDTVDITNLHRQVFFLLEDVGKSKAAVLSEFIKKRALFTEVSFSDYPITKENVFELISEYDIIVDGTDSLPTKYLINDACVLKDKPLVYGSLYKFDGYVSIFNTLQEDGTRSSNLRDAFPKMATDIPNCEEAGTLNPIVGMIAMQQVNEVLKWILKLDKLLIRQLLVYNFLQNTQLKMKLNNTVSKEQIQHIFANETYFDASCEIRNPDWLISADTLKSKINEVEIISVIANQEVEYPFKVDENIPLSQLEKSDFIPKENKEYVFVCQKGNSSYTATKLLKEKFPEATILSLVGGITNY
ncbi:molybdopterin biosynthesis protein MoeB [Tenacibaculum todarodis]|uniref:Molybdopterin biosynthesis protein MoeB n=1 Tax=Tenacibaculum todarodis TaxID=1850252 RepID=A0A1L3JKD0_9FLAO|nr:HesA/MoeB/ThiF family protein [Tenacibaculum todarodis]APG65569.1 molybdopterin biosynthesis protein MoeB [Tenacibaculum todarodis]